MRVAGRIEQGKSCRDAAQLVPLHISQIPVIRKVLVNVCIHQQLIFYRSLVGCGNQNWVQGWVGSTLPGPASALGPRRGFSSGRRQAQGCTARSAREAAAPARAAAAQPGKPFRLAQGLPAPLGHRARPPGSRGSRPTRLPPRPLQPPTTPAPPRWSAGPPAASLSPRHATPAGPAIARISASVAVRAEDCARRGGRGGQFPVPAAPRAATGGGHAGEVGGDCAHRRWASFTAGPALPLQPAGSLPDLRV